MSALQSAWVRKGETVDAANGWHEHHHLAPSFVDGDTAQERSVKEPHPYPGPEQVVI